MGSIDPTKRLQKGFRDVFSLDLRSLAAFRVALALVLLYDLADRSRDLAAHYTEQGVFPVAQALEEFGAGVTFSLHYHLSGSVAGIAALFALAAVAALALLVGYRTRVATLTSWYLLASLQVRNDYIAGMGGDDYLRLMLFWSFFLPLGARWSLDAARREAPPPRSVRSVASAALLLQIFVVYFATGILKSGETWESGTAVYYALNLHQYETVFTPLLLEQPWALAPLTYATLWLERLGPFLLLLPLWVPAARMIAIVVFTGLHAGLALFLDIGPFPIMAVSGWFALLPAWFWDAWVPRLVPNRVARAAGAAPALDPPGAGMVRTAWPLQAIAGASLLYVLAYQSVLLGFVGNGAKSFPATVRLYGTALRINQSWRMFAPDPSRHALWIGVDGRLADGNAFDPFRNTSEIWKRPASIPASSRDFRWRQYTWNALLTNPGSSHFQQHHRDFADYVCREWNADHAGRNSLERVRIVAFIAITNETTSQYQKPQIVYEHDC